VLCLCVGAHVPDEVEAVVAVLAGIGLDVVHLAHVRLEGRDLLEGGGAQGAVTRLLARMVAHVDAQARRRHQRAAAHDAGERLTALMHAHVHVEVVARVEALLAAQARKRPVHVHVLSQRKLVPKNLQRNAEVRPCPIAHAHSQNGLGFQNSCDTSSNLS
jgi:hypothetical protein